MPDYGVGDAANKQPPYPSPAPAPHRYQPSFYLLGQGGDLLGCASLAEPSLRYGTAQTLDLPYLLIEYPLSLPFQLLPYEGIEVHRRHRSPRVHDMQLGAGTPSQADGGGGGQLRVL